MTDAPITIGSLARELRFAFQKADLETADLDARMILAHILNVSPVRLISEPDMIVSALDAVSVHHAMQQRLDHQPVSRIIGFKEFWGRPFKISPATLDPRPDTETLIELTLKIIREKFDPSEKLTILDLGTGSGCILLTLLAECQNVTGIGVDINEDALNTAQKNSERLGVEGRVHFLCTDWVSALEADFDIVISNPPYIRSADIDQLSPEVREYDPALALNGGADGLDAYREIIAKLKTVLKSGWVIFELGQDQLDDVLSLLNAANIGGENQNRLILSDLSGTIRTVAAKTRNLG